MDAPSPSSSLRLRRVRLLAAASLLLLLPVSTWAAEVLVWNRNGVWEVAQPVELFLGPLPFGSWNIEKLDFVYPEDNDPKHVDALILGLNLPFPGAYPAEGKTSGKPGLKLKLKIMDPDHGEGTLTLLMDPGLHRFLGKVKFGDKEHPKLKGEFVGVYDRASANPDDVSDLALRVAFTAKQKAKGLKPGGTATVLVAVENLGPQPFHVGIQDLRLAFDLEPGDGSNPIAVAILKILTIDGLRGFDIELAPDTVAPFRVPMAVKDVLLLGVKFAVPIEAAGHVLTARVDLPPVDPGEPSPIVLTDQDSVPVNGVTVTFKLLNTQDQNPIHIVLDDGRPAAEQFTEDNRVPPGGSKTLKVTNLQVGEQLVFLSGRGGTVLGTCSGNVIGPGKGTIAWNPTLPPALRLSCG